MLQIDLGGGFKHFWFSPRSLGKWFNLTNIFQLGWNHQLEMFVKKTWGVSFCFDRFFVVSGPVFFLPTESLFFFLAFFFWKMSPFMLLTWNQRAGHGVLYGWLVHAIQPTSQSQVNGWTQETRPQHRWNFNLQGIGRWGLGEWGDGSGGGVDEWWFVGFVFWIIYKKIVLVNYSYC